MAPHTRPRPSSIDLLPEECEAIVAWAAQELAAGKRTQADVYADFRYKLIALQGELGLDFDIPARSSFNRFNTRLATTMGRQRRAQMIADAVVARTDGEDADNLTQASTRLLKTLILEMMEGANEGGFTPKEAQAAAQALYRLAAAETVSTARRQKIESEVARKAEKALDRLAVEPGVSKEAIARARRELLGVRPKAESGVGDG